MSTSRTLGERPASRPGVASAGVSGGEPPGDFIFVRDFVLGVNVGVYAEEKGVTQEISFSVEAYLAPGVTSLNDDIAEVPSYADIIDGIEAIAKEGHIELVETFAERIATHCLSDRRIAAVRVRLEKLERGPRRGVEIYRKR